MGSNVVSEVIQHADGRIELRDYASIQSSPLYNDDLAPVPLHLLDALADTRRIIFTRLECR